MSFGNYAGTAIVPTLSRIVLGIAFITAGYNKVFNKVEFVGDDATRLMNLEVLSGPTVSAHQPDLIVRPASFLQEDDAAQDAEQDEEDASGDAGSKVDDAIDKAADQVQDTAEKVTETIDDATRDIAEKLPDDAAGGADTESGEIDIEFPSEGAAGEARAMHHVTLIVDRAGWPQPVWQARLLAFTELIGGSLLLVGLFSRVWGLGLAVAMAVAFYLTSLSGYFETGIFETARARPQLFSQVFTQASLFVLAFGIFLTGPGPLSLDRLFFGRRGDKSDATAEPSFE